MLSKFGLAPAFSALIYKDFAEAGGLIAYGPNLGVFYRHAAYYVDKILRGTNPADLPVEQPAKFELLINLKTAKALGLTVLISGRPAQLSSICTRLVTSLCGTRAATGSGGIDG